MMVFIDAAHIGEHKKLFCFEGPCHFTGHTVGIDIVGLTIGAKTNRRNDGNIVILDQEIQKIRVNLVHGSHKSDIDQVHLPVFINIGQMFLGFKEFAILAIQSDGVTTQDVQSSDKVRIGASYKGQFSNSHRFRVRNA